MREAEVQLVSGGIPAAGSGAASPQPEVQLVSGEAVHLDVRLARAGSRVLALMIDIIAQIMLYIILITALSVGFQFIPFADEALLAALMIILVAVVLVGYPTVTHALFRGRSPGKLAVGLRVVRSDGGPITWRHSFTRALVGAAVEWPGVLLGFSWLLSLSLLVASPRAQRLADLAADTLVIHDRTPSAWGWVPTTPPQLASWASTLDLTNVDDQLALSARHFLARSRQLAEPHRTRLGEALARELVTHATPAPPASTPGWAYLAAIVGERHRRAAARLVHSRTTQARLWPELFAAPASPATKPLDMPYRAPSEPSTTTLRRSVP